MEASQIQHGEPRRLVMSAPTPLRQDFDGSQVRGLARKTKDGPQARSRLSTMGQRAPRRPRSAVSDFRSSGTGCCASTPAVLTVSWMASRQDSRPSSTTLSGRPSPASGDAVNAVLAAAGYNFRRLIAWLRFLLLSILITLGLAAKLKS